MRRQLSWLLAVPIAVIGTLAGHSAGYWMAVPDAHERAHVLASSGHGYLEYAPLLVAICLTLVGLGFAASLVSALGGREASGGGRRVVLVAALAPVVFVLQEVFERFMHDGHLHAVFFVSPLFLFGLAMQVPFALLAAAVAFALGVVAHEAARVLKGVLARRSRSIAITIPSCLSVDPPVQAVLARGYAGRGPPLLA